MSARRSPSWVGSSLSDVRIHHGSDARESVVQGIDGSICDHSSLINGVSILSPPVPIGGCADIRALTGLSESACRRKLLDLDAMECICIGVVNFADGAQLQKKVRGVTERPVLVERERAFEGSAGRAFGQILVLDKTIVR